MIASPPRRSSKANAEGLANIEAGKLVDVYARAVVGGDIVANRYVRLACERHLRDLARDDVFFDYEKAGRAIRFFPLFLRLAEGPHAGKPFELSAWQMFVIGACVGWYAFDDEEGDWVRRFRNAYVETGKGSGKTPMAAGLGVYGMVADDEAAAEVYSASTSRDNSTILWTDAKRMVEKSPALRARIEVGARALAMPANDGTFQPVSAEAKNLHGHRPHIVLVDEEHAHPGPDVIDAMRLGTKGRRNAIIFRITNSGFDRNSICWFDHQYSINVLEGVLEDDSWFAFVCGLDACEEHRKTGAPVDGCAGCDQWTDEAVWTKANPNIGVSITRRYLRETVREALGKPAQANVTKRLNFCIWTEGSGQWLDVTRFAAGVLEGAERIPTGRRGFGGLDLASVRDLAAFVVKLIREACRDEGHAGRCYDLRAIFWCPEEGIALRSRRDHVPYELWRDQGWLRPTPGDVADYDRIRADIVELGKSVRLLAIGHDRWNATQIVTQLQGDGFDMIPVGQGYADLTAPAKRLEADIAAGLVHHDGNPVLTWMVANAIAEQDAAGNLKPSRAKSSEKIDGVAAWCDALFAEAGAEPEEEGSVYDDPKHEIFV